MTTIAKVLPELEKLDPYAETRDWLAALAKQTSWEEAYRTCDRGDRLAWLAGRLSGPPLSPGRRKLVLALVECVEPALPYASEARRVVEQCLQVARAWAHGKATANELDYVDRAVYYASTITTTNTVLYAAIVVLRVATIHELSVAMAAVDVVSYAADTANDADAYLKALRPMTDIIRRHYPSAPTLRKLRAAVRP